MKQQSKRSVGGAFRRFSSDQRGNLAAVIALLAVPLMMAGGAAVDYGSWVSVQARLQAATDAAALAAGREAHLDKEGLERLAINYFQSNFGKPGNAGTPQMTLTIGSDGALRIDSRVTANSFLMKVVGQESQVIVASAEVSRQSSALEVVLVFDNTGSMSQRSRLSTLKVASRDFVDILFGRDTTSDVLKIGVVPFSQFVNVGPDNAAAAWLDTEGKNPLSRENFDATNPGYHNWQAWNDLRNRSWTGCVESRAGALSVSDAAPDPANPETMFPPAFAPDEPDTGSYRNSYLDDRTSGSPAERQENFRKYRGRVVTGNSRGPDVGCNIQPIQPLTNIKGLITSAIAKMKADGYTHVAEGVGWGLRVLSPGEPFTQGVDFGANDTTKVMVLLTDGENTFNNQSNHNLSTYTAYGYLGQKRLGTDSYWAGVNKQNELLKDACNNVKSAGVTLYSFAYNVPSATQRSLIKQCASSPEKYFDPPSNAALVDNFQQIAGELRQLHLSR